MAARKLDLRVTVTLVLGISILLLWYTKGESPRPEYTETIPNAGKSSDTGKPPNTAKPPRRVNTLVTAYDVRVNRTLHDLIQSGAGPRDPRVLDLIRYMLDPPSDHMIKHTRQIEKTPQLKEIEKLVRRDVSIAKLRVKRHKK